MQADYGGGWEIGDNGDRDMLVLELVFEQLMP